MPNDEESEFHDIAYVVVGLALLALVIATVVWLFERTRVDDFGQTLSKGLELEAISLLEGDEALESGPALASDDNVEGSAAIL